MFQWLAASGAGPVLPRFNAGKLEMLLHARGAGSGGLGSSFAIYHFHNLQVTSAKPLKKSLNISQRQR